MGNGVAHQAHPAQDQVTSDERAGNVRQRADEDDASGYG
jgi:hypothetical protein